MVEIPATCEGELTMATIVPERDEIKKAIKWVSEALEQNPDQPARTSIE